MDEDYNESSSQQSRYDEQDIDPDTDRSQKRPESGNEKRK